MIKSNVISKNPCIINHTLSGNISEMESRNGVNNAVKLIQDTLLDHQKCAIIINVSNYSFETLEARRIWSLQFKMNATIQHVTDFVAIVGSNVEPIDTEKMWMKTIRIKFFEQESAAEAWLKRIKSKF